jgi:hypothetical protein
MLKALLNKGGAGKSISRVETAERLSALMRSYNEIMYSYDAAIGFASESTAEGLEKLARVVRDDIGKVSELILSAGGIPPSGTEIEPENVSVGNSEEECLETLNRLERAFGDSLKAESAVRHHLRVVAGLDNTSARTSERLAGLQQLALAGPVAS